MLTTAFAYRSAVQLALRPASFPTPSVRPHSTMVASRKRTAPSKSSDSDASEDEFVLDPEEAAEADDVEDSEESKLRKETVKEVNGEADTQEPDAQKVAEEDGADGAVEKGEEVADENAEDVAEEAAEDNNGEEAIEEDDHQDAPEADQEGAQEEEADVEESALDPKRAAEADADDGELHRPAPKRQRKNGYGVSAGETSPDQPRANEMNPGLPSGVTPRKHLADVLSKQKRVAEKGNVVYWMTNHDLRLRDNHALSISADQAKKNGSHLIVLHVISPQDYAAHSFGPRLVDFILRNLSLLKKDLDELNIPLVVRTYERRTEVPKAVVKQALDWGASHLYGNIEYEVDELWRDAAVVQEATKTGKLYVGFVEDTYIVPPNTLHSKSAGKPYAVFSPWHRAWGDYLDEHWSETMEEFPRPPGNDKSIHEDKHLKDLFDQLVPESVNGFECKDKTLMEQLWPAGEETAQTVLKRFLFGKSGLLFLDGPATADDIPLLSSSTKKEHGEESRFAHYNTGRNLIAENGTSHLSPYLSAGVISARECLRQSAKQTGGKLAMNRDSGPGQWNIELGFRDFYGHVLAAWPRVCMGRAFVLRYEEVVWDNNEETFNAWCEGRTGYPIVDACMRQCNAHGAMHNRGRMIAAMFLTKHLMHDWHKGEQYFMSHFIDGNFASNNGGWQWSASTGTDPQPYFRIFNPVSQSEKTDPTGDYIRFWVPELKGVKGPAIHMPYERLDRGQFNKLKYPKPIVDHAFGRDRALRRFKEPGTK